MLTIEKTREENRLTLRIAGKLDTVTAQKLANELDSSLDGVDELTLDMKDVYYISSAGLRVLLYIYKAMSAREGTVKVNASKEVQKVFKMTGFSDFVSVE